MVHTPFLSDFARLLRCGSERGQYTKFLNGGDEPDCDAGLSSIHAATRAASSKISEIAIHSKWRIF